VEIAVGQNLPDTACTGQVRAFAHTFGEGGPNGGFGVWRFFPPNPALAGTPQRACGANRLPLGACRKETVKKR